MIVRQTEDKQEAASSRRALLKLSQGTVLGKLANLGLK